MIWLAESGDGMMHAHGRKSVWGLPTYVVECGSSVVVICLQVSVL